MRKIIYTITVLIIVHCTLFIDNCMCQWQPDVRLTNDPAHSVTSYNNAWCVASSGSVVHVVWRDEIDGNTGEIYYKRSTDAGVNWGTNTRLTNNNAASMYPSVAVSGSVVHVVWYDYRDGNFEIYYKRSTDAGLNWEADIRLTNNTAESYYPSIAIFGSVVHVVWQDYRDGNFEIYYKHSTDAGVNWGTDTRLSFITAVSQFPSVAVSGSVVHVVWQENPNAPLSYIEIYYERSTDGGESWEADIKLSYYDNSQHPSVAVSGSAVHVVWRNDDTRIYYKRSTDAGVNWEAKKDLSITGSSYPSIAVSGLVVHAVWVDNNNGNTEIYYKRSTDAGVNWGTGIRLTNAPAASMYPSVAVSGSAVHVVWYDYRNANNEIYYKRDPTGNTIGIINISSEIPSTYSLSQNYPNPFNPSTNVQFSIPNVQFVSLKVFDMLGKEVATLVNEKLKAGTYEVDWNASQYPSGVYFYKLETENFSDVKKLVLVK